MPIYEYACKKCGDFEITQRITEPALKKCPTCGAKVSKLISQSAFHLKGTGWYVTDFKNGKPPKDSENSSDSKDSSDDSKEAKGASKNASKSESKSDTKAQTKSESKSETPPSSTSSASTGSSKAASSSSP